MTSLVEEFSAALDGAFAELKDQATSIVRIEAESFLDALRASGRPDIVETEQFCIDMLTPNSATERGIGAGLSEAREIILEAVNQAELGMPNAMIFTQRLWSDTPSFHIDTAALTLVMPLRHAPTQYLLEKFRSGGQNCEVDYTLLMDSIPYAVPVHSPVQLTKENEIVLMKGAAWSGIGDALVHSPPSIKDRRRQPTLMARAIILEFRK